MEEEKNQFKEEKSTKQSWSLKRYTGSQTKMRKIHTNLIRKEKVA